MSIQWKKVAELTRAVTAADAYRKELVDKLEYIKKAIIDGAHVGIIELEKVEDIEVELTELNKKLNGDNLRSNYEYVAPSSIKDRINLITGALWYTTAAPTTTFIKSYDDAAGKFDDILVTLKLVDDEIKLVEDELEKSGAPYTPGRFPEWRKN